MSSGVIILLLFFKQNWQKSIFFHGSLPYLVSGSWPSIKICLWVPSHEVDLRPNHILSPTTMSHADTVVGQSAVGLYLYFPFGSLQSRLPVFRTMNTSL